MNESGIQIRIGDLLYAVVKRWKMILAMTFAGLLLGLALVAMSYLRGSNVNCRIESSVAVQALNAEGTFTEGSYYLKDKDYTLGEDMVSSVIYVLQSDRLIGAVISDLGLSGVTVDQIQNNLTAAQYNETQIIEITLNWNSEKEGKAIVNQIVTEANTLLPEMFSVGSLSVINEPQSSRIFGGSENSVMYLMLTVVGFVVGVGISVLDLLTRPTLLNLKDVEPVLQLETIGTIPEDTRYFRKKHSLLSDDGSISIVEENYASAAYILRNRIGTKRKHQCMYVTSTMSGEGKTTAAANLAVQLADMEHRVLLLDLDMRNPNLGGLFLDRVDYSRSLNALYRGEIDTEGAITHLTGYLDILPTVLEHNPIPIDGSLFELITSLKNSYDYIIMDAPSVGEVSDALSLNQVADSVIFVIKYDTALIDSIRSAITKLDKSGIRILGCIVNGTKTDAQAIRDARNASRRVRRAPRTVTPEGNSTGDSSGKEKSEKREKGSTVIRGNAPTVLDSLFQEENREEAAEENPENTKEERKAQENLKTESQGSYRDPMRDLFEENTEEEPEKNHEPEISKTGFSVTDHTKESASVQKEKNFNGGQGKDPGQQLNAGEIRDDGTEDFPLPGDEEVPGWDNWPDDNGKD